MLPVGIANVAAGCSGAVWAEVVAEAPVVVADWAEIPVVVAVWAE